MYIYIYVCPYIYIKKERKKKKEERKKGRNDIYIYIQFQILKPPYFLWSVPICTPFQRSLPILIVEVLYHLIHQGRDDHGFSTFRPCLPWPWENPMSRCGNPWIDGNIMFFAGKLLLFDENLRWKIRHVQSRENICVSSVSWKKNIHGVFLEGVKFFQCRVFLLEGTRVLTSSIRLHRNMFHGTFPILVAFQPPPGTSWCFKSRHFRPINPYIYI